MKYFRADLHVHSRFSRATSGRLNIRNLAAWSMIKGLSVMSTGDFTHPAWRDELRRDLVYDDNSGLYRVREKTPLETEIPGFSRPDGVSEPQFLIQAEISSIYKKDGSVRKVHNVVIMPSLESADKLSNKLAAIGNITSDGRPILGLDCEHLLEMVLEADERGVLIPAHIWTPWFSLFGSKSGFDALEDCFGSLSSHIFALETGLSSDPDMNRLWSALDRYALVSNSDAHSGENLGREANLFEGTPSYDGIFDALRRAARDEEGSGCIYRGTVEFFPEEGKYHLDGHRACNVVLEPEESMKIGNICPVCGFSCFIGNTVNNTANRKTQESINFPHPFCVTFCQIIVDRDNMDALAFQCVQIGWQCSNQSFTFTCFHFSNTPLMENDTTDNLHLEVFHADTSPRCFSADRKCLYHNIVQRLALCQSVFKLLRFSF